MSAPESGTGTTAPRSEDSSATSSARLRCRRALVYVDTLLREHSRKEMLCDAFPLLQRYLRSRCRPWPWPRETSTGQPENRPLGLPYAPHQSSVLQLFVLQLSVGKWFMDQLCMGRLSMGRLFQGMLGQFALAPRTFSAAVPMRGTRSASHALGSIRKATLIAFGSWVRFYRRCSGRVRLITIPTGTRWDCRRPIRASNMWNTGLICS
jgi:hypothetical protein